MYAPWFLRNWGAAKSRSVTVGPAHTRYHGCRLLGLTCSAVAASFSTPVDIFPDSFALPDKVLKSSSMPGSLCWPARAGPHLVPALVGLTMHHLVLCWPASLAQSTPGYGQSTRPLAEVLDYLSVLLLQSPTQVDAGPAVGRIAWPVLQRVDCLCRIHCWACVSQRARTTSRESGHPLVCAG